MLPAGLAVEQRPSSSAAAPHAPARAASARKRPRRPTRRGRGTARSRLDRPQQRPGAESADLGGEPKDVVLLVEADHLVLASRGGRAAEASRRSSVGSRSRQSRRPRSATRPRSSRRPRARRRDRPSRITSTRWARPSTSSYSDEISSTADPGGGERVDQLVDRALGADIDAACRLVGNEDAAVDGRASVRTAPSAGCRPRAC